MLKQLLTLLVTIFLICMASVDLAWSQKAPENRHFEIAEALFNDGQYNKALPHYSEAIKSAPRVAELYTARANCWEYLGELKEAVNDLQKALKLAPNDYGTLLMLGQLHFRLANYALAIETYTQILEMPASETTTLYFKESLDLQGHSLGAESAFTLESSYAEVYHGIGLAYAALNAHQSAIDNFDKAIGLDAGNVAIYLNRSKSYLAVEETKKAINDLEKVLSLQPENSMALYNLAGIGQQLGKSQEVKKALGSAILSDSSFGPAYVNRGVAHFETGNYQAALADYDLAIRKGMENAEVYLNRGLAKEKLYDTKGAIQDFSTAIRLAPNWYKPHFLRGNVYFHQKKYAQALEDYDAAAAWAPKSGNIYYNRALTYKALQQSGKACEDLRWALQLGMKAAVAPLKKWCN